MNRYTKRTPSRTNNSSSIFASLRPKTPGATLPMHSHPAHPQTRNTGPYVPSHTTPAKHLHPGQPQTDHKRFSNYNRPRTNTGGFPGSSFNKKPYQPNQHHSRPQSERINRNSHNDALSAFKDPTTFNLSESSAPHGKREEQIPPLAPGNIRIIPLGGVEEIGKNMTMIEIGQDIIVIDAGFQFQEDETPGIDYILPNTKYLENNKGRVRGLFITHGHLDHIGAVPYIMDLIGNPPIYTRELTSLMLKKRQEEFPHLADINYKVVDEESIVTFGSISVSFFKVTHTIPDAMGLIIKTPYGNIIYTGDLKVDTENGKPTEKEEAEFSRFTKEKTLLLLAESTNVENPGFTLPERVVAENLEKIIREAQGRLIVGTFSSLLERIIKIIEIAEKYGKKVVIEGRSMKNNIEIVKKMGVLKAKPGTIIPVDNIESYPPDKIVVVATGAQGDEFAALMRMSTKSHKYIKLTKRDTIVLSSSVVPGNEMAVQKLKDNISRHGTRIIHYKMEAVHSSGHANRDEIIWVHKKINPKYFIPIHGYHHSLRVHTDIALGLGMPEKNIIIPDNGTVIEIQDQGEKIVKLKEKAPSGLVLVDGFSVGNIQEVVIRDRQMLAQDGMFVIIASINPSTGKIRKSPDIISRGFVYLRESQELLQETRNIIKKTIEESTHGMNPINFDYVKNNLTDNVSKFLYQKTNKRPMVIPVLIGV
ncbi:MAG: ribonuclease J [Minisyncoccia bacterium]